MRIKFGKSTSDRVVSRIKKKARIRKKVTGSAAKPRLCVYRSTNNIYAQLIDDDSKVTLGGAGSQKMKNGSNCEAAKQVGAEIAKIAKEKNIETVVFDRNGFIYHGRVKSLADAAREAGLKF